MGIVIVRHILLSLSLLLSGTAFHSTDAFERLPALPQRMAVLGDSMSEALFSNQSLENGLSSRELLRLLGIVSIRNPERRLEAFRGAYADHGKVWSSGDDPNSIVFSHLRRIRYLGKNLTAHNYAVSSSVVADLSQQVDQLLNDQKELGFTFDYVTLIIGANDFNVESLEELPQVEAMAKEVGKELERIIESNPGVAILWMGLPHILKIFKETEDILVTSILGKRYTCGELRPLVYGKNVIFNTTNAEVETRVQQELFNYQWQAVKLMDQLQQKHPAAFLKTIQGYGGFDNQYERMLAFDCFHPSEEGQAALAEISWTYGFWGDTYGRLFDEDYAYSE
jgi:lysophospholipase L1-like esterase